MSKDNTPLHECPDVVEMVCELLGRRYKKSQIKAELRKIIPDLSFQACDKVIKAARQQIVSNYKIDPSEYRGYLIEELERLLRNDKTPIRYRLKTIHELAELLHLHHIGLDSQDPAEYAKRIAEAIKQMDGTIQGVPQQEDTNAHSQQTTEAGPSQQEATQKDATLDATSVEETRQV